MRTSIARLGAALLLVAAGALAQSIDQVKPACAAPGDAVMIKGKDFGPEPTVLFGTTEAEILRSGDHGAVDRWRREQALERTRRRRPDLLDPLADG